MWTWDRTDITFGNSNVTFSGSGPAPQYDVPGNRSPHLIDNSRAISRSKSAAWLLILGGSAVYSGSTDVHAAKQQFFEEKPLVTQEWKGFPLLSTLSSYPADIVQGWDTEKWPGEPPFLQAQRPFPVTLLTTYAPYNPAPDVVGKARYAQFVQAPDEFTQAQKSRPLNLQINPVPVGDLQIFYRKTQFVETVLPFIQENKGTWQITLQPDIGPNPPLPPAPPMPVWPLPSTITNLPVRGTWELPGSQQAIWVIGNGCFLMTVNAKATGSTEATFHLKRVGNLVTNTGPVCIRDNGAGGTVVIVDGANGYYYTFSTAGLANSATTLGSFTKITDPAFLGADRVAFIDGWWILNQPNSQTFYTPDSTYSLTFNGTNFALTDGATDNLVTLYENKEELWLVCERHTEIWYDAGGQYFAFQRLVSTMLQVGCSAKHSIARFSGQDDGLIWLALSERGQNVVVKTQGFGLLVVSTPPINDAIASYTKVDDAIGYTYQEDGHEFYVLTFPSAVTPLGLGATWVYDGMTELWHERLSFEPYSGTWNRHRSNCFLNFQNQRLVGDYQNGSIYQMTRSAYTDNGWPLVAWRRSPHVWDGGARERVFMASLQLEFSPGVGNSTGLGVDPQAVLSQSKDGGTTFGQEIRRSIGKIGNYLTRTIWRRLGVTRDSVFDVKVYDPVKRDIVGATLRRSDGDNSA